MSYLGNQGSVDLSDIRDGVGVGLMPRSGRATQQPTTIKHLHEYNSFAGTDIVAQLVLPEQDPVTLGELQTISYSIHRENHPVRTLGHVMPIGFVKGGRCIPAGEKVYVEGQGLVSIEKIQCGDFVQSSGSSFNKVLNVFDQGIKPTYELKLKNGNTLRASYDHPVYSTRGWVKVSELEPEDKVYVAGFCPSPEEPYDIDSNVLKMIALLIGDGHMRIYTKESGSLEHRIGLAISKKELDTIGSISEQLLDALNIPFKDNPSPGCTNRIISVCLKGKGKTAWSLREYNMLHEALLQFDMYGSLSHTKFIPEKLLANMNTDQIAVFLNYLFSTDGYYSRESDNRISAGYTSTSERLIDEIRLLLLKLGIRSSKYKKANKGRQGGIESIVSRHDAFSIQIRGIDLIRFYSRIGILGKDAKVSSHINDLISKVKNVYLEVSPGSFLSEAKAGILRAGKRINDFKSQGIHANNLPGITPRRAIKLANNIEDPLFSEYVQTLVQSLIDGHEEFYPCKVKHIKRLLDQPVYDIEVEDRHSFICEGVLVHNTIAGSMIFTVFNSYAFYRFEQFQKAIQSGMYPVADMLPPFDVVITFANEYGVFSKMKIYGVTFVDEGGVMSIDDIITESTFSYMARGIQPLTGYVPRDVAGFYDA